MRVGLYWLERVAARLWRACRTARLRPPHARPMSTWDRDEVERHLEAMTIFLLEAITDIEAIATAFSNEDRKALADAIDEATVRFGIGEHHDRGTTPPGR